MVIARTLSTADIDFQGKHADEVFQFQFHQHWIRMLWPICKFLMWNSIVLATGILVFDVIQVADPLNKHLLLLLVVLTFLLASFELLKRFYSYLLYVVVITDKKLHRIKKTLLMTNDHISLDIWMVQDMKLLQKGFLQNLLGYGTIVIHAQETVLRLHFVPSVLQKYEKLLHLREQARTTYQSMAAELKWRKALKHE